MRGFEIVIASEAKQSRAWNARFVDCFVALLLAMTKAASYARTAASPGTAAKPALLA
jgi:hypothetical protein